MEPTPGRHASGMVWALWAGLIASLSSICGKVALSPMQQTWLCDWLKTTVHYSDLAEGYTVCDLILATFRVSNFILLIAFGAVFWTIFNKALVLCSSSAEATVVSTACNFFISGAAGRVLFGETLGLLWYIGAMLILVGLALIHRGSTEVAPKEKVS